MCTYTCMHSTICCALHGCSPRLLSPRPAGMLCTAHPFPRAQQTRPAAHCMPTTHCQLLQDEAAQPAASAAAQGVHQHEPLRTGWCNVFVTLFRNLCVQGNTCRIVVRAACRPARQPARTRANVCMHTFTTVGWVCILGCAPAASRRLLLASAHTLPDPLRTEGHTASGRAPSCCQTR